MRYCAYLWISNPLIDTGQREDFGPPKSLPPKSPFGGKLFTYH